MKLALYLGCLIPTEQYAYEISAREVLPRLGVDLADLEGFACCGTPVRSINSLGWLYLSARVMAIAEEANLDLLPLCNTCHLSLCTTRDTLQNVDGAKAKVNSLLADEGLKYEGNHRVWHVVELLHDQIGLEKIRSVAKRSLKGVKLASHIGCHAIRPNELGRIDNPENPRKLDELIEVLGAESPNYPERLDCCGYALSLTRPDTSLSMTGEKVKALKEYGFHGLITACPLCHRMYDAKQSEAGSAVGASLNLPVLYYLQLLGLAMGLNEEKLGLALNQTPVDSLISEIL